MTPSLANGHLAKLHLLSVGRVLICLLRDVGLQIERHPNSYSAYKPFINYILIKIRKYDKSVIIIIIIWPLINNRLNSYLRDYVVTSLFF